MLNTIYLGLITIEDIVAMIFIVFLIYSAIKRCCTAKNYKIRLIFSAILCILNMGEALVENKLRISSHNSILLTVMWLIEVFAFLILMRKENNKNKGKVMTENKEN